MKSKTYRKIFFTFLTIIVLYTFAIMVIVIRNEINQRSIEQSAQNKLDLDNSAYKIDQQLHFALNSMKLLATKDSIIQFSQSPDTNYGLFSTMYDEIRNNFLLMNQAEYSVGIMNPSSNIVVSSDGYFVYPDFFTFLNIKTESGVIADLLSNAQFTSSVFETLDHRLIFINKEQIENQELYFFAYWKKDEILSTNDNHLMILDQQYLSTNDSSTSLIDFSHNDIQQDINATRTTLTKSSEVLPFVSFQLQMDQRTSIPFSTVSSFLIPLLLLILVGSIMVVFLSRRFYRPYLLILNEIKKGTTDTYTVDDINRALHQMIESTHSLTHVDTPIPDEVKDLFLKNLLFGKYDYETSTKLLHSFHLQKIEEEQGVFAFFTFFGEKSEEINLKKEEIIQIRKQLIKKISPTFSYDFISFTEEQFVLIIYKEQIVNILKEVEQLKDALQINLDLKVTYLLSKPFHTLESFIETFHETCQWVDYYNTEIKEHPTSLAIRTEPIKINYSVDDEQLLIHSIKVDDFPRAKEILQQILAKNVTLTTTLAYLQEFSMAYTLTLKRVATIKDISYLDFYKKNQTLFTHIKNGYSDPMITEKMMALFERMFKEIKEKNDTTISKSDEIIQYINKYYCQDLSLTDIAEQFHLTEPYVSKLIKESLGMSFKPYLNQLRVEKAKQLLTTQTLTIQIVAEKVGFKSTNSFIRVFKQFEGVTPGNYRSACL
ncbi:helix-turn-helix transcriptional regulator [Enterococcus sp. DIV0876]|uniref:helix-turn-helix transcriptional regulator n=1 Tax=Enterococcus sp. DIV0876 TaxID=2774633 RepID=UPI003D300473